MKKIYYISETPADKDGNGISYKIYKQMDALKKGGFDVSYICVGKKVTSKKERVIELASKVIPFFNYQTNLDELDSIQEGSDVYIRYFLSDGKFIHKLKMLKNKKHVGKIIIEVPTFPYDGEMQQHIKGYIGLAKDKYNRRKLKKYVDRVATFSADQKIWGINTINLSNGVDTNQIFVRKPQNNGDCINMLAVAHFGFWHGYDRMIEGLHRYYSSDRAKRNVKFYIVGYGNNDIEDQYRKMIEKYQLKDHVFLVGRKQGPELDYYYNICDLGIDSMGRHRSNVYYNSSLKGKEYLAKGLPIVSGVKTELDSMPKFQYYFRVPADDSPVDIESLIEFYDKIYANKNKAEIAAKIRDFCVDNFDIDKCFEKVVDCYKENKLSDNQ